MIYFQKDCLNLFIKEIATAMCVALWLHSVWLSRWVPSACMSWVSVRSLKIVKHRTHTIRFFISSWHIQEINKYLLEKVSWIWKDWLWDIAISRYLQLSLISYEWNSTHSHNYTCHDTGWVNHWRQKRRVWRKSFTSVFFIPPYICSEVILPRAPDRREVGQDQLTWKVFKSAVLNINTFTYTIREELEIEKKINVFPFWKICHWRWNQITR